MSNTKHLSRKVRKGVKRKQRMELKKISDSLTKKDRKQMRKMEERIGIKQYALQKNA